MLLPRFAYAAAAIVLLPAAAYAGMPSITLSDVAKVRLENISFFLAGFLLSAWLVKLVWNFLGRDWTFLPRLSYGKALGLMTLWGLLFILVLTMISGARELMTPGAWEKQGSTYRLAKGTHESAVTDALRDQKRHEQLEKLRGALWAYAVQHQGEFPAARTDPAVPAALWKLPDPSGVQYLYVGGKLDGQSLPLAFEPEIYGNQRMVLYSNGEIRLVHNEALLQSLPAESKP